MLNYDQWEIEFFYEESDYDKSEKFRKRIDTFWRDKKLAQIALAEIKERIDMLESVDIYHKNLNTIGENKRDWMVFHEKGDLLHYQIALLMEDGSRKIFSSFWDQDNFKHIEKIKIVRETFVEDEDEIIF